MAQVIGTVKELMGTVKVVNEAGVVRILSKGDVVYENETVEAMVSSQVTITLNSGKEIIIEGEETHAMSEEYINSLEVATTVTDIEQLLDNPNTQATALGEGGTQDGGAGSAYYHDRLNFPTEGYELGDVAFSATTPDVERQTATAAVNDVTTVVDDSATTNEDAAINIDVIANDTDVDSKSPVATVTQGANGTVEINADGIVKYTPNANFNGTDTFTYTNTEGNTGTVTVTVDAVNNTPDAADDTYLLPNIDGLVGEYFAYNEGQDGQNIENLSMASAFIDGKAPDATFFATSINYGEIVGDLGSDGTLQTFLGDDAASLNTDPANSSDAIIKLSGNVILEADTTYYFRVTSDDGFSIAIDGSMVASLDSIHAPTVTLGSFYNTQGGIHNMSILYWDQAGQAVLKVEVSTDGTNYSILSTDNVLLPINNTLITDEDTPLVIAPETLLSNDTDSEGDALTITGVSYARHGSVVLNDDGTITFTPEENYSGEATFVYTIADSNGGIDTATVSILVNPVNDAPDVANATANIYVPIDDIKIANLAAGFSNAVFKSNAYSTSIDNDNDTFQDAYYWGDDNSIEEKSGYILVDNSAYQDSGSEISTDSFINFGTFTHQNLPIYNGTLETINMDINFDVIINGVSQSVSFTIAMNHTETPNSGSDPRDIITLPSETYTFALNGQEYTVSIEGFQDTNGNIVQTIYTDENASNSYTVVGKIVSSESSLPTVAGSVIASDAEDGNLIVLWGDTQSDYGTLIAKDDGTYSFEVNRETKDSISSGETLTETFTYSVTDSDGVTSSSTLTINIGGYDTVYSSTNNFLGDSGNNYLAGSDGSADILNGGAGNDVLVFDSIDTIDGGDGKDTLLIQEDITLDFDSISDNISNIEIIDLDTGSQDITISASDVLDMTDGDNVLEILGDASDSVTLSGTWTATGTADGFNIYTSNDTGSQVTIKIEEDINNITVS